MPSPTRGGYRDRRERRAGARLRGLGRAPPAVPAPPLLSHVGLVARLRRHGAGDAAPRVAGPRLAFRPVASRRLAPPHGDQRVPRRARAATAARSRDGPERPCRSDGAARGPDRGRGVARAGARRVARRGTEQPGRALRCPRERGARVRRRAPGPLADAACDPALAGRGRAVGERDGGGARPIGGRDRERAPPRARSSRRRSGRASPDAFARPHPEECRRSPLPTSTR